MTANKDTPSFRPAIAIWLGSAAPVRTIRWLDGALKAAAKLGATTAIAAGEQTWLDLAADRAARVNLASVGVPTELQLDYLGWAQVVACVARQLSANTILVDEASRPGRFAEVAAIAELLDTAQLTHTVALACDGATIHASRAAGAALQTVRIHGPSVIGVRIAGAPIDDYPTPTPSAALRRIELTALGLDPLVLGHRAIAPRSGPSTRRSVERIAELLAVHAAPPAVPDAPPPAPHKSPAPAGRGAHTTGKRSGSRTGPRTTPARTRKGPA